MSKNPVKDPLQTLDPDAFRDSIATVDAEGKRNWIYPKMPKGRFYKWRKWVSGLLLLVFFVGPWLRWNGNPMFLFNILERKFIVFGNIFWPQDFFLFVLALITFFIFIMVFTVVFGRIWCGWACPQTVFMEMVFRRIEYWIEGTHHQQRKLANAPWTADKIRKKVLKFSIFALIALVIGNTVMSYIIGTEEMAKVVTQSPLENWGRFTFTMIFSGLFFFVFAYLREQACIAICPYGRLQGVLLSKDSLVVVYDWIRGEPRGKKKKEGVGDCVDCKLCVQVCPTGIDIRNGTQLECVNCTACIDVCDEVMDKLGRDRGLIRYDSYAGIDEGTSFRFDKRVIAYSAVLLILVGILSVSLFTRSEIDATVLRTPGTLYQRTPEGNLSNLYQFQLVNKTTETMPVELRLNHPTGLLKMVGTLDEVDSQELWKGAFFVEIPPDDVDGYKTEIEIEVWSGDRKLDVVKTNFLGPI